MINQGHGMRCYQAMTDYGISLHPTGSHWVSESKFGRVEGLEKEEVFLYFRATWRGQPCEVTMSANRYRHSEGMSDWRVYATDTRDDNRAAFSDTARRRLSDAIQPLVVEWLASDAYRASESAAYAHMILRGLRDSSRYDLVYDTRRQLAAYGDKLATGVGAKLAKCAEAYDTFARALKNAESAISATEAK